MDDLGLMILAGKILGVLRWTDAEIDAVKKGAMDVPADGMTGPQTFHAIAQFVQKNPGAKASLLHAAAKTKEVRVKEREVIRRVLPLLKDFAPRFPDEAAGEELRDLYRAALQELWPDASIVKVEGAIGGSFGAHPQQGWVVNAEKAVELMEAPEPAFPDLG